MRGMRALRNFKPDRCYHLISRIANRAFYLTDEERTRFVERLWRVAKFSGIEVLAYCFMRNHFTCSSIYSRHRSWAMRNCSTVSPGWRGVRLTEVQQLKAVEFLMAWIAKNKTKKLEGEYGHERIESICLP